jgi:hypothetical protein
MLQDVITDRQAERHPNRTDRDPGPHPNREPQRHIPHPSTPSSRHPARRVRHGERRAG